MSTQTLRKRLATWRVRWHHISNTLATPLLEKSSDAPIWRVFFWLKEFSLFQRRKYTKPPLTHDRQLALLESRGLVVADRELAKEWLRRVNYYRLSAYLYSFRIPGSDDYKPGTTLTHILDIYHFDRRLRLILMDAIECIEVWLRTAITYELAHRCGAFGYLRKASFNKGFDHRQFRKTLWAEQQKSKESFVEHYRTKYTAENHLPIWMATELLTFGTLSMLYSALPLDSKKSISAQLDLKDNVLANWLQSITYLRNLCAHHSRVWNRKLAISPKLLKGPEWKVEPGRTYAALLVLERMLSKMDSHSGWSPKLTLFITSSPTIDTTQMGFPLDWKTREPFKIK